MTEKVKVSRELATAIETALEYCGGKDEVLQEHIDTWSDDCIPLNSLSFLELAEILINGYEVEQTQEEKIKKLFYGYAGENEFHESDAQKAILELLEILEKKVEGVNK
ncbi:hypothetical protein [Rummeliibacillus sp. POC4]|uniref:hypothetical protein n=1 Tax=Rummeliibacillus sp. POC4 TaxID=2305899 RepID=UPI000E6728F1|nr:hypothetical protein [Rummeliibacillus sp. POC4]RIJ64110.1 hypothetical protein D1606_11815 [Rummeliibacillus sp. POC4]